MSATSLRAKLNIVDSEKSAKLQMANIKETLALGRKLNFLDRSEKLVVNRIRVDQKVIYKRFQMKLTLSKLEQARRTGNKELERELVMARGQGDLNTNIGKRAEEEEQDMLKKIWQGARRAPTGRKICKTAITRDPCHEEDRDDLGRRDDDLDVDFINERPDGGEMRRQRPVTAFVTRMSSARHKKSPNGGPGRRRPSLPLADSPLLMNKEGEEQRASSFDKTCPPAGLLDNNEVQTDKNHDTHEVTNKTNSRPRTALRKNTTLPQLGEEEGEEEKEGEEVVEEGETWASKMPPLIELDEIDQVLKAQPSSVSLWCRDSPEVASQITRHFTRNRTVHAKSAPPGGRRKRQRTPGPQTKQPRSRNMFEEETGPSLLDVHRLLVKNANYEEKVKQFCETIKPYEASEDNITDYYYSLRLTENKHQNKALTVPIQARAGDCSSGGICNPSSNVKVRSLTLKSLNTKVTVPVV